MGAIIFTVVVMVLVFFGVRRLSNLERAQKSAFQKLANQYGYSYSQEDDSQLIESLRNSGLNLIREDGESKLFNIITGNFEASTVTAFTYKHETKPSEFDSSDIGNVYFTLAVLFKDFGRELPMFSLFPRRSEVNQKSGIELSSSDKFNKRYVLSSNDEPITRSMFEPHAERLADHKISQYIYCDGNKVLFTYKGTCTGRVVEKRIDSAHEIFKLLFVH